MFVWLIINLPSRFHLCFCLFRKLSGEVTVMLENEEEPLIDIENEIDNDIDEAEVMVSLKS